MVRVYRLLLRQVLVCLMYVYISGITSMNRMQRGVQDYLRNTRRGAFPLGSPFNDPEVIEAARFALDDITLHGHEEYNKSLAGLIRTLAGILRSKNPMGEKGLLEAIVEVLNLPYGRNALSGSAYDRLVDALLIPSETAGLVRRLRARELACCGCGHQFADAEIGTIVVGRQQEGIVILCANCSSPGAIRCKRCEGSLPLPKRLFNAIRSKTLVCESCKSGAGNEAVGRLDYPGEPMENRPEPPTMPRFVREYVNNPDDQETPFDPPTLTEEEDQIIERRQE